MSVPNNRAQLIDSTGRATTLFQQYLMGLSGETSDSVLMRLNAVETAEAANATAIAALDTRVDLIESHFDTRFYAVIGSALNNVTGDGTAYVIPTWTEVNDPSSAFNPASGIFTAPSTGLYFFAGSANMDGLLLAHTAADLTLVASSRSPILFSLNPFAGLPAVGVEQFSGATLLDMTAADTAKLQLTVTGGTKVVDITSGWFCAFKVSE